MAEKEETMIIAIIGGQEGECMDISTGCSKIGHHYGGCFWKNKRGVYK